MVVNLTAVWDLHQSRHGTKSRRIKRMFVKSIIGVDGYNQSLTGDVSMCVTCAASDCHHVPMVIVRKGKNDGKSERKPNPFRDGTSEPN